MKILKPYYYDEFYCIGGACKDTCCIGWQIHIDKKSFLRYRAVKGEFGKRLNSCISKNRKTQTNLYYAEMKLEERKCQLLNRENLCDIYINLGEDYLCNTCKIYPRLIRKFGDVCEKSLSLSCPEVARILMKKNKLISFDMEDVDLNELERQYAIDVEYNKNLYELLWEGRSLSIEVAQFREIQIWKRIVFIKTIEEKLQNLINENNYTMIDNTIEYLRNNLITTEVIKTLDNIDKVNKIKAVLIYMILQRRADLGKTNDKFWNILDDFNALFEDQNEETISQKLDLKESEFNEYFTEYEYILENYIVYNLYNYYMLAIRTMDINKEIVMLIIKYATIKILLLAKWSNNGESLSKEDIIDVLYSFSRVMEHNEGFINDLYLDMKKDGYDTLGYLTILVR